MPLQKLARELGVSYQQLQKYENGINQPKFDNLFKAAQILGVPLSYFFEGLSETGDVNIGSDKDALTQFIHSPEGAVLCGAFMQISERHQRQVMKLVISIMADNLREKSGAPNGLIAT